MGTGGAAIKILDLKTGQLRETTLSDLYDATRLVDQLKNIHFLVRPCIPTDIPKEAYDINMFYACLKATQKHVMSGVNDEEGLHKVLDMAAMIAGSKEALMERPFISFITSIAISPLKLCTQSTLIMQEANRNNIPVAISSAPMAGSNYIHHSAGMLESMLTIAHEQFVMDDEIIGNCCKVLKGIDVDSEHLALDVIDSIGPGGNYMADPHTMKHMRNEYFQGNGVTNRKNRSHWEKAGALDATEMAKTIAKKLIANQETTYIDKKTDDAIRSKFNILLK